MSRPQLPYPEPAEVLLVATCYENGAARWGDLLDRLGDVLSDGAVRLRPVQDPGWDGLAGGHLPALVPDGAPVPPVVVVADIPVVYGGDGPLLVDLTAVPGRGVRVPPERLREVLAALLAGRLEFDELVRDMDVYGMYQGDGGRPAHPEPPVPPRRSFPALPAAPGALLVRTAFDDEDGWRALLDGWGGVDGDGWVGADLDPDDLDEDRYPLTALVVDDRAFEGLLPGEVPALVPPPETTTGVWTTLVVLADARTFAGPGRPLTVVDLHDTPGQPAVLPHHLVGSMAANLEIGNMDFSEFVPHEGAEPWWETP